jgi:tRNA uracil 4-sulfurtransferase
MLVLSAPDAQADLVRRGCDVMGISVVQPALEVTATPDQITAGVETVVSDRYGDPATDRTGRSFAVRVRRHDKSFPLTSQQLAVRLGEQVRTTWHWTVDLRHPDVTIWIDVYRRDAFISVERHRGQGGLPVGSSGQALVLLSGGFDSPVAAYRAMKRGLRCDFVHFTGAPLTGPASAYKAYALARHLARYQGPARLHIVPLGSAQRAIATAGAGPLQILGQRRLMIRIGELLAPTLGAQALVTGDCLGQVSSQTLTNLAALDHDTTLPLLRPLLAWDKEEIIAEACRLGTEAVSRLPDEDCCRLLTPPVVATHASPDQLATLARRARLDDLADAALSQAQAITVDPAEEAPRTGSTTAA